MSDFKLFEKAVHGNIYSRLTCILYAHTYTHSRIKDPRSPRAFSSPSGYDDIPDTGGQAPTKGIEYVSQ